MRYGSLYNSLYDSSQGREPEVGMGATMLMWSDRHAATVVEVRRFKTGKRAGKVRSVTVQRDTAVRQDNNGMSDAQEYEYRRNPDGELRTYNADSNGRFKGLALGFRSEYYDFSF